MKILFAGTPDIAVPTLRALAAHFEVVGVLTSLDKPKGRKKVLTAPPVKEAAVKLGLPVIQFDHLGREAREAAGSLGADTLICFAYGKFFGPKFLSLFDLALNIHPSLLPVLRGPSPIQGAILSGLAETGISIQKLAKEMDSGDLCAQMRFPLDGTETDGLLTEKVAGLAPEFVVQTLSRPLAFTPQQGIPSFCKMIGHEDGLIDWNRPAREISAQVRAFYPWPKAQTSFSGGVLFLVGVSGWEEGCEGPVGKVLRKDRKKGIAIQTGAGILWVSRLQKQQKNEMDALAFLNGNQGLLGAVLGE